MFNRLPNLFLYKNNLGSTILGNKLDFRKMNVGTTCVVTTIFGMFFLAKYNLQPLLTSFKFPVLQAILTHL